jgi:histidine triad (HIT) family protein
MALSQRFGVARHLTILHFTSRLRNSSIIVYIDLAPPFPRVYAPYRGNGTTTQQGEQAMNDCIFCKIVAGQIPAKKLYEDDDVLAFWDIAPQAPVHFLVIPKKHIAAPVDVQEEDDQVIGKLIRIGSQLARENGVADGFRVIFNNGKKAGQEVFHIHLHIIGGREKPWRM